MNILITGATGFIGSSLTARLHQRGATVWAWTRDAARARRRLGAGVHVVQSLQEIPAGLPFDGIVNLAGAPVIGPPWTRARRQLLIDSRVKTTQQLLQWSQSRPTPGVLISASAIGYYGGFSGAAADAWLTEESPPQSVFQSRLCEQREAAANAAAALGIRVVNLRIGLVLGRDGGIFQQLARPARWGLAATLGDGRQWMSWIHLEDLLRIIDLCLEDARWSGAVNAVAPEPVRQAEFQAALASSLHRPHWLRVPASLLRLGMGEMAELLVDGQRVAPRRLLDQGFSFQHGTLASALRELLADRP